MLNFIEMFARRVERFSTGTLGLKIPPEPTPLTQQRLGALLTHLQEEVNELRTTNNLRDAADACVDVAWIAIRGLVEMGFCATAAVEEVARANGDKVRGGNAKRPGDAHDAVKPPGWRGPDWEAVERRSRLASCGVHAECNTSCPFRPGSPTPDNHGFTPPSRPAEPVFLRYSAPLVESDFDGDKKSAGDGEFMKHDGEKDCRPELVPAPFLWELAKLFARGAVKYAPENWRKGRDLQRYVGSLERHVLAWRMGEDSDRETGVHHLVCAAWSCCVIFMAQTEHPNNVTIPPDRHTRYSR
jgi:hypothetical protein